MSAGLIQVAVALGGRILGELRGGPLNRETIAKLLGLDVRNAEIAEQFGSALDQLLISDRIERVGFGADAKYQLPNQVRAIPGDASRARARDEFGLRVGTVMQRLHQAMRASDVALSSKALADALQHSEGTVGGALVDLRKLGLAALEGTTRSARWRALDPRAGSSSVSSAGVVTEAPADQATVSKNGASSSGANPCGISRAGIEPGGARDALEIPVARLEHTPGPASEVEPDATSPTPASPSAEKSRPRFALWSDGTLTIRRHSWPDCTLLPFETQQLVAYLDRIVSDGPVPGALP